MTDSPKQIRHEAIVILSGYSFDDIDSVKVPLPNGYRFVSLLRDVSSNATITDVYVQSLQENILDNEGQPNGPAWIELTFVVVDEAQTGDPTVFAQLLLEEGEAASVITSTVINHTKPV